MNAAARAALSSIRACLTAGRYRMTVHFRLRLAERSMLWVDLLTIFDSPTNVRSGGKDDLGRPKWIVAGRAADGLLAEVVCVLDRDEQVRLLLLITLYFES
ncbi:MAG: hypothetical protein ACTHN5_04430 [Phycisphaerae bacterium]